VSEWRNESTAANYKTTDNLRARTALFEFLVESPSPPPPLNWFDWPADARVLDVGCGTGTWLRAAHGTGATVVGLDLSHAMLAATRAAVPDAPLTRAGATALPFAPGSFDTVLALWMLYHVDDKEGALREFARVLASGGHVIAGTNADGSERQRIDEIACDAIGEVVGTRPDRWFPVLDFNAENGEAILASVFPTVEANHFRNRFEVTVPDVVTGYVASMSAVITDGYPGIDLDAVLSGVQRRAADDIARRDHVEIISNRACFRAS
jgi:SAM-dependent methyltransferase